MESYKVAMNKKAIMRQVVEYLCHPFPPDTLFFIIFRAILGKNYGACLMKLHAVIEKDEAGYYEN
jgi:hypothetical protein